MRFGDGIRKEIGLMLLKIKANTAQANRLHEENVDLRHRVIIAKRLIKRGNRQFGEKKIRRANPKYPFIPLAL